MSPDDAYVMLLSSLPSSERLFIAKQPPISKIKLDQRLRVLTDEDAATLRLVQSTLRWAELQNADDDPAVVKRVAGAVRAIEQPDLREIIQDRLELRTTIAALRRRADGQAAPPARSHWGFGRWVDHIRRNWTDPGFRLETVYPWLPEAARLIGNQDALALERLILQRAFLLLQRVAARHSFDLEAVVIYVLKWDIFDRWARSNGTAAERRFDELTEQGLADVAGLDLAGGA